MIGVAIAIVAFVTILIIVWKDESFSWFMKGLLPTLLAITLFFTTDLIAHGLITRIAVETTQTPEIIASEQIVALQDNNSESGSFFLGSGSINNQNYYAFYYETPNGFKYMTLDAEPTRNPVYIKYIAKSTETPHIDRYAIKERKTWTGVHNPIWYSLTSWFEYGEFNPGDIISDEIINPALIAPSNEPNYFDNYRYEIHIPEGSIKTGYEIDIE